MNWRLEHVEDLSVASVTSRAATNSNSLGQIESSWMEVSWYMAAVAELKVGSCSGNAHCQRHVDLSVSRFRLHRFGLDCL